MSKTLKCMMGRWWLAAGVGVAAALFLAAPITAQEKESKGAKAAAKEPVKETKPEAKEVADDAKEEAKDAAKDAKEATDDVKDAAKDTAKGARDTTKSTAKDARDAAKGTRETTRDTVKGTRDTTKDTEKGTRDTVKGTRETTRDTVKGARDTTRETTKGARDTVRETRDTARDTARDTVRETSRETSRSIDTFRAQDFRSADFGIWFNRSTTNGLVISDVSTRGPIARLGFREGDRIISVNAQKVTREADFVQYLFAEDVRNERVEVVVFRGGKQQIIYVEPIVLIKEYYAVQVDPLEQFGLILDDRYPDRIVVWRVVPRSPAFYAGIRAGDVIVTFGGERVTSADAFVQLVQDVEPGNVAVEVMRDRQARTYEVEVPRVAARAGADVEADVERGSERREGRIEERREERREDRVEEGTPPRAAAPAAPAAPAPRPGLLPRRPR